MVKRKKKQSLSRKRTTQGLIVGVAWYTPEQWDRLKSLAVDAAALDDTYQDWLKNATVNLRRLKQQGYQVVKVPLEINEWVAWCQENDKALDGAARSAFTAQKVSERFGDSSSPS
jgi:hypothetical protein